MFVKRNYILVCAVLLAIIAGICFVRHDSLKHVSCRPIIFVHGFGNKGNMWVERQYPALLKDYPEFIYLGNLSADECRVNDKAKRTFADVEYPYWTISLKNKGFDDVRVSAQELKIIIDFVKANTAASSVTLIGFSLGGVVCREYLTSEQYADDVDRLITISSPHLGSEFAVLYDLYAMAKESSVMRQSATTSDVDRVSLSVVDTTEPPADMTERLRAMLDNTTENLKASKDVVLSAASSSATQVQQIALVMLEKLARRYNVSLEAESLSMLHAPLDGNYLDQLNRKPHPRKVRYTSIITSKYIGNLTLEDVLQRGANGNSEFVKTPTFAVIADSIRYVLSLLSDADFKNAAGDGFVSTESQDMANIEYFKRTHGMKTKSINVQSSHLSDNLQKEIVCLVIGPNEQ